MAQLDDFEKEQADVMAARFLEHGMSAEQAAKVAKAMVLKASAEGILMILDGRSTDA